MDFFIALLAVLAIALFFVMRFRLNAAVAPFFAISLIVVWLCLTGMLNLLVPAVWAVLIFALFCLVWIFGIKKTPVMEILQSFFTPGMVFFISVSVAFYIALRIRNPYFTHWDEYSFWGTSMKAVFQHRQLYTLFTASINNSYPPSLALWTFFIQFFGKSFAEWKVYLAYDVLTMSVMAMLFARVDWKKPVTITILFLFGLGSLYIFYPASSALKLYCTAYADTTIGVVFGGVILSYFMAGENKVMRWLAPLVGIVMLTYMKDIGMALGLIAAGVISVDMVISKNYPFETFLGSKKKWLRLIYPLTLFAAAVVFYLIWNAHYNAVTTISRVPDPYIYTPWQVLTGKDPYFIEMLRRMTAALFTEKILSFGTVFVSVLVFTLLPILLSLLTRDKKRIVRVVVFSLLMAAGFFAYYYFHAYLYTTIFTAGRIYDMHSYGRYISCYFVGWMVAAFGVGYSCLTRPDFKKFSLAPICVASVMLLCSNMIFLDVSPRRYVFLSPDISFNMPEARQEIHRVYADFEGAFTADDRIYFVCQQSDGSAWYYFNYEYQPAYTVEMLSSGDFVSPDTPESELDYYETRVDRNDFEAYLIESDSHFVYVHYVNQYFLDEMAPLFSDGLSGHIGGSVRLYMVVPDGDGIQLIPVNNHTHLEMLREQYGVGHPAQ